MSQKNAKNARNNDRKARAEEARKQSQRQERLRSMLIIGLAVVIVAGLLTAALIPYIKDQRAKSKLAALPIAALGASPAAAACDPVKTEDASGNGDHVQVGTPITYPDNPPAFGKHWGNFLVGSEIRNFYSPSDRPEVERLVHSLEHGHTIVWYDDSIKPGTSAYQDLKDIAEKVDPSAYLMVAPWTGSDGGAFPDGKHVALTHWTGPSKQTGVWEYCSQPSGTVIKDFLNTYPPTDAPEPGAA